MMSSGTSRAARTSKDKANKVHTTQNVKSEGPPLNMKNQPTAEQMRLAQMISDKNEEDPDLRKKIKQVTELTACSSEDSALLALHDCDYDLNRAVERLLENENNPSEWKKQAGKKRKPSSNKPTSNSSSTTTTTTTDTFAVNSKPEKVEKKEKEVQERGESAPRGRRDRGPPRFQRGRGRETNTTDDNDSKFWSDNRSRERGFERGRGRGRGASGGRGRGRGSRGFKGSSSYRFEKGPQIDTWTNETAENAEKENSIGAWGDVADEWVADEWTGSLEESKVFTSSAVADSKGFTGVNDNDAKMFTPPPPTIQTQVFTATSPTHSNPSPSTLADTTNTYQHSGSPLTQNSLGQQAGPPLSQNIGQESSSAIPQNSMGQQNSIGQPSLGQNSIGQSTLGQRLDLEMLLNASKAADASNQQYLTQFAKEAEESIKIAVGIGINNSASSNQMPMCIPATGQSDRSVLSCQQQPLGQRQKAPRTKLPPPSRIPESAVEMPGGTNVQLDVQFGNWEETMLATTTPTPPGFNFRNPATDTTSGYSFGSSAPETSGNNSYTSTSVSNAPDSGSLSNHLSAVSMESNVMTSISNIATTQSPISTLDTGLDTVAEPSSQSSIFPNPSSSTPPKDYSQSGHTQSAKISSQPEPIPYPTSQSDRSAAAYNTQRSNQSSGSLSSNKSGSSQPMTFTQSGYSSGYQPSSYKPSTMTTSGGYSHTSSVLTSSGLQNQSQYTPGYQSSSYPPNSGYNQGQSSLYHQSPSQSNSFQSQTAATYQSQSYSRDSQSAGPSYQASVSQNSSSYQSGASPSGSSYQNTVSNSTTSTYQRDSQSAGQTGGYGQSYGSSNHQNSLQTSPMSANKLSESLSNMSVDDTGLDQTAQYKGSGSSSPATTLTTPTPTNSSYLGSSSVSVTSALGLTTSTSSSIASTSSASTSKSTLPVTSRAPPGVPPGVPLIGATPNIMIGQPGFHLPFGLTAAQQPAAIYGFDELQLLQQQQQQRQAIPADYYSLQFQTPTTLTGREQGTLGTIQYNNEGKLNHRVSANSPVNAVNAATSQTQQTQSAHQQTFINPTIPPGYNYYYHGGVIPGGYSYTTPYLPVGNLVPSVTNAHGATTASVQFQKPGAYGTHAYTGTTDVTGQAQDLSKTYGGVAQPQGKASAASLTSSASDITAAGVGYGKSHAQTFDKSFPGGTPPPFNLPIATGNQAGPMGAPTAAYGGQYVPMMTHQPHSQILAHHLQQDTSGGGSRASQQSGGQPRAGGAKNYTGYWGTN